MVRARWILPSAVLLLASCQPAPHVLPVPDDPNARAVLAFLHAYGQRDLEGMMRLLEEDAVFRGSGGDLSKAQIRDFFQASFRKHPNLRVEVGTLKVLQDAIHASVKVETDAIWTDTWVFEMRGHKIRAYSLASGKR
jgi:ketosteroid isomerase-like protein